MHLLLALDQGFEQLAAVALTSYLLHQRFESVVLVTPDDQRPVSYTHLTLPTNREV